MQTQPKTQLDVLAKALPYIEGISVLFLVMSGVMMSLETSGALELFMIAMSSLAIVFFLNTRIPVDVGRSEDSPLGFKELLVLQILPKVMWISTTVSTIGILFYFLKLTGFDQMLLIGASTTGMALVVLAMMLPTATKHGSVFRPILLRALPVFAIACYLLYRTGLV